MGVGVAMVEVMVMDTCWSAVGVPKAVGVFWGFLGPLGVLLNSLGALLGFQGAFLGSLGSLFGLSWDSIGLFWALLGSFGRMA